MTELVVTQLYSLKARTNRTRLTQVTEINGHEVKFHADGEFAGNFEIIRNRQTVAIHYGANLTTHILVGDLDHIFTEGV